MAKSEAVSLTQESFQLLQQLEAHVSTVLTTLTQSEDGKTLPLCVQDLFTIFFYMYAQHQTAAPEKGYLSLIFELLRKAQVYIANMKEESETNLTSDISLKNDEIITTILGVC